MTERGVGQTATWIPNGGFQLDRARAGSRGSAMGRKGGMFSGGGSPGEEKTRVGNVVNGKERFGGTGRCSRAQDTWRSTNGSGKPQASA